MGFRFFATYLFGYAIATALLLTSLIENDFYDQYINGNLYLIWAVYITPCLALILLTAHLLDSLGVISTTELFWKFVSLFKRKSK